jgi:hypothetical protein
MCFIMRLFFYVRVNAELQTRSTSNPEVSREHLVERVVPNALATAQVIGFGTSRSTFNPEVQTRIFGGTRCLQRVGMGQVIGFGTRRSTVNPKVHARIFGGTRCP